MKNTNIIAGVIFSLLSSTTFANAIEIQIIDKDYNEHDVKIGRTLQSDLDNAEKSGTTYEPVKTVSPKKVVKRPPAMPEPENDPVYTVPVEKEHTNNLQSDLDKNPDLLNKEPNNIPVEHHSNDEKIDVKPMAPEEIMEMNKQQEILPPVENVKAEIQAEQEVKAPVETEKTTVAPTVREPVLLGNMTDDELKSQLGITENDIQPPQETMIEPQAGIEESFMDETITITAPPTEALESPTTLKTHIE